MRNRTPEIIPSARIPGTRLPRPTNDFVFKRLMQNNLDALKSLLTAVLDECECIELFFNSPIPLFSFRSH